MDGQTTAVDEDGADSFYDEDDSGPAYDKDNTYWAQWRGGDLAQALEDKNRAYVETARTRGLIALWIIAYAAYHGLTPSDLRDFATQQIGFEGDELELMRFHINVVRSYIQRAAIMALGERANFKAMVVNDDHKSQVTAELADKIINALYDRYVSNHDEEVAEGDGFVGMCAAHFRWDVNGGDTVSVDAPVMEPVLDEYGSPIVGDDGKPETQQAQLPNGNPATHKVKSKSGAPVVTVVYPWSYIQETRSSGEQLWVMVREAESKWNVCAQFPDFREAILQQNTMNDEYDFGTLFRLYELEYENKDLCIVKHFYHARCPAVPDGRYCVIVGDVVVWDAACPVKEGVPVAAMCSNKFIETTFGYCDSWDMLAISQALNQVNSDEMQNYSLYGRQSVAIVKGTNQTEDGLTKGTVFEVPQGSEMPRAVQLTAVPPTLPALKQYLHGMLDHISGQNGTSRGEPEANVRSGEMAALLDSIALRYQSYRQQAVRKFRIRSATIILDMLKRYGETPFLVEITGIDDRCYVSEFTREDVSGIERITMDVISPIMQTIAGRWQVYSLLKDLPDDQRAAAYELITTGNPSLFVRKDRTTEMQIRRENEDLVTGAREVFCTAGEDSALHYVRHWAQREAILASDNQDEDALARIDRHLSDTVQKWLDMSGPQAMLRQIKIPPPALGPTQDNEFGNPMYQLQMQMSSAQASMSTMAAPPVPMGGQLPENAGAAGGGEMPGGNANQQAASAQVSSGSAAQVNDQAGSAQARQRHPSGTSLPQPSTPPAGASQQ